MKMINFYELSGVFILLGSACFLTRLTKKAQTKAWLDLSYFPVILFKGKPKFENKQTDSYES